MPLTDRRLVISCSRRLHSACRCAGYDFALKPLEGERAVAGHAVLPVEGVGSIRDGASSRWRAQMVGQLLRWVQVMD